MAYFAFTYTQGIYYTLMSVLLCGRLTRKDSCKTVNIPDPTIKSTINKIKGQLQPFHKLSLFDRFRHVENGLDINF